MNRFQLSSAVCSLTVLAALSLLAVGSGCGGKAAECAYLCERAATCSDQTEPLSCAATCTAYATTGGVSARTAVSHCASCVAGATCTDIGLGHCDAACPLPALQLAEAVGLTPGGGSSTGGASSAGGGSGGSGGSGGEPFCEWRNDASARLVVRCRNEASELNHLCNCFEDGVDSGNFWTNDFCTVNGEAQRSRAARGCHWTL